MIDIIVVGAGASGMVAAIMAARCGASVLMLEHMDRPGKKLLVTGNGRCNYTNEEQSLTHYHGEDPSIVAEVFEQFGFSETVAFFEELGIYPKIRNGYYYPNSDQAASILEALLLELRRLHVEIRTEIGIRGIKQTEQGFFFDTKNGAFESRRCILACGGKAAKKTGSDGSGYLYAKPFGHTVVDTVPALVQLTAKQSFFKKIAGIRTEMTIQLYVEEQLVAQNTGELQITEYGISGIPVFQVSRFAAKALQREQTVMASIDFMPSMEQERFTSFLLERFSRAGADRTALEAMNGLLNQKLSVLLLELCGITESTSCDYIKEKKIRRLAELCKHFCVDIDGTKNFDSAQVCAGGISTTQICHQSMESTLTSGLYFAGEILDVDGECGGYNLQWAWSSGAVAGTSAAKSLARS